MWGAIANPDECYENYIETCANIAMADPNRPTTNRPQSSGPIHTFYMYECVFVVYFV